MFREHTLTRDGRTLGYASGPENGPPLVLLHGVTRCGRDFEPLTASLSTRWQLFTLDFRGHGRSSRTPGGYLVIDYIADALALAEHLDRPLVIYGHSLGAMVAAAAAAKLGERCRALILEDPPFETLGARIATTSFLSYFQGVAPLAGSTLPVEEIARQFAEIRTTTPGKPGSVRMGDVRDPASIRFSAHCLKDVDPEVLAPIIAGRWLQGFDRERMLAKIEAPTLLLQGNTKLGGMLPDDDAAETVRLLAHCSHVRFADAGHLIHWQRTDETLASLHAFLGSIEHTASAR